MDGNRVVQRIHLQDKGNGVYENRSKVRDGRFSYHFQVTDLEGNTANTESKELTNRATDGLNMLLVYVLIILLVLLIVSILGILYAVVSRKDKVIKGYRTINGPQADVMDLSSDHEHVPSHLAKAFSTVSAQGRALMNAPGESIRAKRFKAMEEEASKIERLEIERSALMASEEKRIIGTYLDS